MPPKNNPADLLHFEKEARALGFKNVAGVDEVGRGPLAGPVVAACCMMEEGLVIEGVNDSKLLTALQREELFHILTNHKQILFAIGIVSHTMIDRLNIYHASGHAMKLALKKLNPKPDCVLVDGGVTLRMQKTKVKKIIHGGYLSQSMAAASIIAKVTRDQMMDRYHKRYPKYGFDKHKGYSTKEHLEALKLHGPAPIHRKTFNSVKILLANEDKPLEGATMTV